MATTETRAVADASPIIHLDELCCLDLLRDFGALMLPDQVWVEACAHRPGLRLDDVPGGQLVESLGTPSTRLISLSDSFNLGAGERAALTMMEQLPATLFLCDDAAARLAAESLGFMVRGTIGILVRSVRRAQRTRPEVLDLLSQLPHKSSLHISRRLLDRVIVELEQASLHDD